MILDIEASHQFGVTSADMVSELREQLIERHVDLYLVRVRWPVRTVLARSGFRAQLGEDHLWHGLSQAVRVARQQHGIEGEHAASTTLSTWLTTCWSTHWLMTI